MNILALDIGTSSIKAALLDVATAQPIGPIAHVATPLESPTPDAAEIPADHLWRAVTTAARRAVSEAGVSGQSGQDVAGVGLSCMLPALVLLDQADRPLKPIWTHLDRRARSTARQVWGAVGEEFLATVGNRPLPGGISVLCYRQMLIEDPYLIQDVRTYLHLNGWLGFKMTGEKAFDPANACFTGLFNTMTDQEWSPRWCDYFEVRKAWLPEVIDGAATLGSLRASVAAELGVPAGIPVKMGTADTSSALLAAEMGEGDLLHMVGTTHVLAALASKPVPARQRLTRRLGVGPAFVHVTHNPVGGVALDWLHRLCFQDQPADVFFARTIAEAQARTTRVTLDPPFLGGDRLEIEACRAAFRDLELTTDRLDLLQAVLTAMARRHTEALAALGQPLPFRRIFLTGGGADVVERLLPEYHQANVSHIQEASLRGVAHLFR